MEKQITHTVILYAPLGRVWDALVNPEQMRKYMFDCEAVSDWKKGSPLLWKMEYKGHDIVVNKGEIVDIQPEKLLSYSVIDLVNTGAEDAGAKIEDVPENYLTVTYELTERDGRTILTFTEGDFTKVAQGERRYNDAVSPNTGWHRKLVRLKQIVEAAL